MTTTTLDPREIAATLGVNELDLADLLRDKAAETIEQVARIAKNDPWYAPEDEDGQLAAIDRFVERAKRLIVAGFACERAWIEDHPEESEDA